MQSSSSNGSSNNMQQLLTSGDFLALTREHAYSLSEPFSFIVNYEEGNKCGELEEKSRCKVSVIDTGIIIFEPIDHIPNKDIVLSSAIHGNETAPIEICAELIKKLLLGKLPLFERVLFIFANPPAINAGERFVDENMNSLFSGAHGVTSDDKDPFINKLNQHQINRHQISPYQIKEHKKKALNWERGRAFQLENVVEDFFNAKPSQKRSRFHYDLHTAIRASKKEKFAVYPFQHSKPWKHEALQFMLSCGVSTILLSHAPTATFAYYSANKFSADSFTIELGKVNPFGKNDHNKFNKINNALMRLISGQHIQLKPYQADEFSIFKISQSITRQTESFSFNFADDVKNFTSFTKGAVIANDGGNEITTKVDGEAIIFPNANVAIGQRALLTIIPTTIL